ncbi:MAG: leucine--tRNA ligase [Planctomycetes bacterium]|nr:leucine--tRNA ligase [Planctomycetota bacterium]
MEYNFKNTEARWQKNWADQSIYKVDDESDKEKFYCLAQFPYPSGAGLHMGHVAIYTYTDAIARFKTHQGYEVLHPMGWDAFGLPTENHAIKMGVHPAEITKKNVANFRKQLDSLGFSYDWDREINTSHPDYFKWTQSIWMKLHEAGLTYKSEMPVNWCDTCKIVVANEEVDADGTHERCHNPTEQRNMKQWMFKITQYAEQLLEGLDELDWPESSKKAQRDWIGKSIGAEVQFNINAFDESLTVFTTRPDTLFGATYMVLAPEHPLVEKISSAEQKDIVKEYQNKSARKSSFDRSEMNTEKTGVFTGAYATNPLNGADIPIWIADYVLMSYGTGAIMAVPAHDTRDFEFAQEFKLPIIRVLREDGVPDEDLNEAFTGDGMLINSSNDDLNLNGLNKFKAIDTTIQWLEEKSLGKKAINYRLRDWIFARQRYWGEPFPVIYNESGEMELLKESDLPLTLPQVSSYQPTDTGESPLASIDDFVNTTDNNGKPAMRETDTMPQWAGSCWYYLRFMDPNNSEAFASMARQKRWGRVDVYVGGTEHLNLHDLYSRFWHRALYDLGVVAEKEPFQKILHQGMILGADGSKMSKSIGNVVNPDILIEKYGADVVRLNLCFMGPVEANKPWNETGLDAIRRFVSRTSRLIYEKEKWINGDGEGDALVALHKTIKIVLGDMERYRFNTAIARMMELLNALQKADKRGKGALEKLLIMLSPFAPHFCEEMWQLLGNEGSVTRASYPNFEEKYLVEDEVEIAVQILGKLKLRVNVAAGLNPQEQQDVVLAMPSVQEKLAGANIKKVISVPGRLINFVIAK